MMYINENGKFYYNSSMESGACGRLNWWSSGWQDSFMWFDILLRLE